MRFLPLRVFRERAREQEESDSESDSDSDGAKASCRLYAKRVCSDSLE